MGNEFYIYLSILTPLIAFFVTPLLSSSPNLRDSLGPIGGIITFYSSLNIASSVAIILAESLKQNELI